MFIQPPIEPASEAPPKGDAATTPPDREGFACPACAAVLVLPEAIQLKPLTPAHCQACNTELKPVFSPAKGLLIYAAFASNLLFILLFSKTTFLGCFGILGFIIVSLYLVRMAKVTIELYCLRGFQLADKVSAPQFSLLDALYMLLFMGVVLGYLTQPREERWQIMLGGYFLWGAIEVAQYYTLAKV